MPRFETYDEWYHCMKYYSTKKLQKLDGEMLRLGCEYQDKMKYPLWGTPFWKALQDILETRKNKKEWWEMDDDD